jgi:hypothetical protein
MTAARRLAAILGVDVVGAARLMGEDEAGTAQALREHCEAAHPITLNANYGFPPPQPPPSRSSMTGLHRLATLNRLRRPSA